MRKLAQLFFGVSLLVAFALPAQVRDDSDGDGVPDGEDLCPATARATRSVVPVRGCSPLQIVQLAPAFVGSAVEALGKASEYLEGSSDFAEVDRLLSTGAAEMEAALDDLRNGDPCGARERHAAAMGSLRSSGARMREIIRSRTLELDRLDFEIFGEGQEHFGDGTMAVVAMEIADSLIEDAATVAGRSGELIGAPCEAVRPVFARGVIAGIDDANSTIELEDGQIFRLPPGERRLFRGLEVQISGIGFGDGSGIATTVFAEKVPAPSTGIPEIVQLSCVDLRIAPVQVFPPFGSGPFTLHNPLAYFHNPRLWLEKGMRFAAVEHGGSWCDEPLKTKSFKRHALKLDLTYKKTNGGTITTTIASELRHGDEPVPIPWNVDPSQNATLTVTEQRRNCHYLKGGGISCGAPTDWKTTTHTLRVEPLHFYASVGYQSKFDLDDDDFVSWRPAQVLGTMLHGQLNLGPNFPFRAEGCRILNNVSSCDLNAVLSITGNQPFAIYNHDFYDADALFTEWEKLATGVDHPAGLKWPRIFGTRNGHEFWYSASVPKLVRDVVTFCNTIPDSYYRLPFNPGSPTWNLGNGNWRSDGAGHCGKDKDGNVVPFGNCLQRYAFDFGAAEGVEIRAARGGIVTKKKESATTNQQACYQQADTSGCDNGNYVFIRHQDGTYGIYWHFKGNQVFVEEGMKVYRGQVLGQNGNTGNSSAPHLHFHVQQCSNIDCGFSILVRFQTSDKNCYTPQNNDNLSSNNQ